MKRYFVLLLICACSLGAQEPQAATPEDAKTQTLRVNVSLVLLNVAVTDNKGNYITGLKPEDFQVSEDGIAQKIATFGEGNGPQQPVNLFPDARAGLSP